MRLVVIICIAGFVASLITIISFFSGVDSVHEFGKNTRGDNIIAADQSNVSTARSLGIWNGWAERTDGWGGKTRDTVVGEVFWNPSTGEIFSELRVGSEYGSYARTLRGILNTSNLSVNFSMKGIDVMKIRGTYSGTITKDLKTIRARSKHYSLYMTEVTMTQ